MKSLWLNWAVCDLHENKILKYVNKWIYSKKAMKWKVEKNIISVTIESNWKLENTISKNN